jgi:hypothetical protein
LMKKSAKKSRLFSRVGCRRLKPLVELVNQGQALMLIPVVGVVPLVVAFTVLDALG